MTKKRCREKQAKPIGIWDCMNDELCFRIFGYELFPMYGDEGREQSYLAREIDALEEEDISEIVFDVLCLLCAYDAYVLGEISEEDYLADVSTFKRKWLREELHESM